MRRTAAALALSRDVAAGRGGLLRAGAAPGRRPDAVRGGDVRPARRRPAVRARSSAAGSQAPLPTARRVATARRSPSAQSASEQGTTASIDQLSALLQAAGRPGTAPAAARPQAKLNKALDTWPAELRRLAGTADDSQLKTALAELAAEAERMDGHDRLGRRRPSWATSRTGWTSSAS